MVVDGGSGLRVSVCENGGAGECRIDPVLDRLFTRMTASGSARIRVPGCKIGALIISIGFGGSIILKS